ncbi:Choline kinase [Golovinomyces cichoracearum]|uniref:Choline kinase n=1 Tax=Golovinomyces cichoracearum TaxID=62708 RepID=A0A420IV29_9PEZI|nr:Choline kinase [Golovinomyces cichoracearum]
MSEILTGGDSSTLPYKPVLKEENQTTNSAIRKVVSTSKPEQTPFLPSAGDDATKLKQFKAGTAERRLHGRSTASTNSASKLSCISTDDGVSLEASATDSTESKHRVSFRGHGSGYGYGSQPVNWQLQYEKLQSQVSEWLRAEKSVRAERDKKVETDLHHENRDDENIRVKLGPHNAKDTYVSSAVSLEHLQKILEENSRISRSGQSIVSEFSSITRQPSTLSIKRRGSSKNPTSVSSDTEHQDGDVVVSSCNIFLEKPKTTSNSKENIVNSSTNASLSMSLRLDRERKSWIEFKKNILKMAHTLRLKGWKSVSLESASDIKVERLSGALTNSVYVVSIPFNLPSTSTNPSSHLPEVYSRKVLLRIYGPRVDQLIDRENELGILQRLARKNIGPKLLGTFKNGRFEEFLNANTLTSEDIRSKDTSLQIAKRMRELHDGIKLFNREREDGPFIWRNWDKWVDRCEKIISLLDQGFKDGKASAESYHKNSRGFICGTEWNQFRNAVDKYRKWLNERFGMDKIKQSLVFAHNDTQYGNILRLIPGNSVEFSPSHKQLVVIDFEYASANTPGLEFANHFTEWCYNYHSPTQSWLCDTSRYPTIDEQTRFIRCYVNHRAQTHSGGSAISESNTIERRKGNELTIDSNKVDSHNRNSSMIPTGYHQEEESQEPEAESQVQELLENVRIWRVAASAQWIAWGIVQAQVPGLNDSPIEENTKTDAAIQTETDETSRTMFNKAGIKIEPLDKDDDDNNDIEAYEDGFDYLSYASDRALFFWGDMLMLGIITKQELPIELVERIKIIDR